MDLTRQKDLARRLWVAEFSFRMRIGYDAAWRRLARREPPANYMALAAVCEDWHLEALERVAAAILPPPEPAPPSPDELRTLKPASRLKQ